MRMHKHSERYEFKYFLSAFLSAVSSCTEHNKLYSSDARFKDWYRNVIDTVVTPSVLPKLASLRNKEIHHKGTDTYQRVPVLPLLPGRAEKHGFEYYRHGTLSLYAALDIKTGQVQGKTASRHTSADFIGFLTDIAKRNPQPKRSISSWITCRRTRLRR